MPIVSVRNAPQPKPEYFLGLDLGKVKDYTALVILERHGEGQEASFHARHLQRYALGTSYPAIVADVIEKLHLAPLAGRELSLAVDETGVGAPVVDLFREALKRSGVLASSVFGTQNQYPSGNVRLKPIHITGGATINHDRGVTYVPKRDLVSAVQVALQTERLKIASGLSEAATLVRELENFQVKITDAANDTYGAWREGAHDDLVLAVALALWVGKRPKVIMPPSSSSSSIFGSGFSFR
jgi:hypothetical protein